MSTISTFIGRMFSAALKTIVERTVRGGPVAGFRYCAGLCKLARADFDCETRVIIGWKYGFIVVIWGANFSRLLMTGPNTSYQKLLAEQKAICPLDIPVENTGVVTAMARSLLMRNIVALREFARAVEDGIRSDESKQRK